METGALNDEQRRIMTDGAAQRFMMQHAIDYDGTHIDPDTGRISVDTRVNALRRIAFSGAIQYSQEDYLSTDVEHLCDEGVLLPLPSRIKET